MSAPTIRLVTSNDPLGKPQTIATRPGRARQRLSPLQRKCGEIEREWPEAAKIIENIADKFLRQCD